MTSPQADSRLGTTLAGYRIESLLGRGGMGVVYLATDERLKRRVALKLIAPELAADSRFRERFLRESELAASLDHPNVVPVYEAGEADGELFLAMRFAEGEDLGTLLAREAPLEPARAIALCAQVAEALDAGHQRGLVHRDVKPANVLVAPGAGGEHCYLTDFGLSRARAEEGRAPAAASLSGTIAYAAPERVAGRFVDGRADVYSLGCVLYECLAGEPPFARRRLFATLAAHVDEEPPSVRGHRPQLPVAIDAVVAKSLAKDPSERYASCGELCEAAGAALVPAQPWWRTRRSLAAAAVLLLAALAAALAVSLTRSDARPATAKGNVVLGGDSLVRLDATTGELVAAVALEGNPKLVVADDHRVWVLDDRATLSRVDPLSNDVSATFDVPGYGGASVPVGHLAAAAGDVWLGKGGDATDIQRLAAGADAFEPVALPGELPRWPVEAGGSLWVTVGFHETPPHLLRIDPRTGRVVARLADVAFPQVAGDDFLWAVSQSDVRLVRVDTETNETLALAKVLRSPGLALWAAASGEGAVWASNPDDETVVRLDPVTGAETGRIRAGGTPGALAAGAGAVWVANVAAGTVSRYDLTTRDVRTIDVGGTPNGLVVAEGSVWVAVDVR